VNSDQANEILEIHKSVLFTDVYLGLVDVPVCQVCHAVLDEPEDWDETAEGDWSYPLVQNAFPCRTRQLVLETLAS
jgi:hypothetical protein